MGKHNAADIQAEVTELNNKFEKYIGELKRKWIAKNRIHSRNVLEVMDPMERAEVERRIDAWGTYITPFAEAWWKERGYIVIWPQDNSRPMQVKKIENQKGPP